MASLSTDANGNSSIQFKNVNGKRKTIYLGMMPSKLAVSVKLKVEAIQSANLVGLAYDNATANWLVKLSDKFYEKLTRAGLVQPRNSRNGITVTGFAKDYVTKRTDLKPGTVTNLEQTIRWLIKHFGEKKELVDVTKGDADEFRLFLTEHLGENTVRRMCKRARQLFHAAVRRDLIEENPFADMKGLSSRGQPEKFHFITREVAEKVLAACPDDEWRLIFALSRFGGLRCPSEHLAMKWSDLDWQGNKITVRSPKTEHHEGKESRTIPMFPELKPYLEAVRRQAKPDANHVITRYREANVNLRTQLIRIIEKAGLKKWPKLFQNLRSTRETELAEEYPIQVVCAWIGNSEAVAKRHYLQVHDAHFEKAIKTLQIPMLKIGESSRNGGKTEIATPQKSVAIQEISTDFNPVQSCKVTLGRFEPPF